LAEKSHDYKNPLRGLSRRRGEGGHYTGRQKAYLIYRNRGGCLRPYKLLAAPEETVEREC